MYKIKPVTLSASYIQPPVICDYANVQSINIPVGADSASGAVQMGVLDDDGVFQALGGATVALTKEQYQKWGTDDSYAEKCLIENLGLELA